LKVRGSASAEPVALFTPEWLIGSVQGLGLAFTLLSMTGGWRHVFLGLFARYCVAVALLRRRWVGVLEASLSLAPTLFGFCALSTV